MAWETKKLGDVCNIQPSKSALKNTFTGNETVSFIPMKDLSFHKKYPTLNETKKFHDAVSNYTYFSNGDVLLAKITPCFENGKLGIAKNLLHSIGFGSSEFIVLRPNPQILSEYLYYFLTLPSFVKKGRKAMKGAAGHKRLPRMYVENQVIPLPPLQEQQRIVAILDKTFEKIEKIRANTEKNLKNAKELFDSYLQQVFSQGGEDWETKKLGDVCDFRNGRTYKKPEMLHHGKYRLLRVGNFFTSTKWYYSDLELDSTKYCEQGDLLYAWSASFGPKMWNKEKVIFHYHIWRIDCSEQQILKHFLYYWLLWDKKSIQNSMVTGSTMLHISMSSMKIRHLSLPPIPKQKRIVAILDKLSDKHKQLTQHYTQHLTQLEELKQSILQQAFSGKLTTSQESHYESQ